MNIYSRTWRTARRRVASARRRAAAASCRRASRRRASSRSAFASRVPRARSSALASLAARILSRQPGCAPRSPGPPPPSPPNAPATRIFPIARAIFAPPPTAGEDWPRGGALHDDRWDCSDLLPCVAAGERAAAPDRPAGVVAGDDRLGRWDPTAGDGGLVEHRVSRVEPGYIVVVETPGTSDGDGTGAGDAETAGAGSARFNSVGRSWGKLPRPCV